MANRALLAGYPWYGKLYVEWSVWSCNKHKQKIHHDQPSIQCPPPVVRPSDWVIIMFDRSKVLASSRHARRYSRNCWRFSSRDPGFESCSQQRKTICLLSIRKSLGCTRASKLTTYIYRGSTSKVKKDKHLSFVVYIILTMVWWYPMEPGHQQPWWLD